MFYPMLKRLIRSIGVIVMAVAIGLPGHVLGSMLNQMVVQVQDVHAVAIPCEGGVCSDRCGIDSNGVYDFEEVCEWVSGGWFTACTVAEHGCVEPTWCSGTRWWCFWC